MRAARYYGAKDIRIEDIPEPEPGPNEVLVEVEWCGICGTDLHEYLIGPLLVPRPERPHPITKSIAPVTLGHEFCGRIIKAPNGSRFREGQAVVADPRLYCGSCAHCAEKNGTNACHKWGFLGLSGGGGGGLSSVVAVHERMLHLLPDEASLETAAVLEPLTVAWHAVKGTGITDFGDKSALILGGGPIGIAAIHSLRAFGAKKIIVSEPTIQRRKQTEKFADVVIDPAIVKVPEKCIEMTDGKGVDIVLDCAGVPAGIIDGMSSLKLRGIYMNVAAWETPLIMPMYNFMSKEIAIKGSMAYNDEDFREVVEAFSAGKLKDVPEMVSSRIGLKDLVKLGFEELINNKDEHVKILVSPKK